MVQDKYKFAFVSHSDELADLVKQSADDRFEEVTIKFSAMEDAIPVAKKLFQTGTEVILGGWGTGSLLVQAFGQPVVKIERSYLDIISALIKGKSICASVGLTSFGSALSGLDVLGNILGVSIEQIVFRSSRERVDGITSAVNKGISCVIGGGLCKQVVESLGGTGIVVLPSMAAIQQAFREAGAVAASRRKEREDFVQLKTVLETIKEGVMVIDTDSHIKVLNRTAAEFFGIPGADALGNPLPESMLPTGILNVLASGVPEHDKIQRVGNVDIVITSTPIVVNGQIRGVVANFKEASRIQNIERKLREQLYERRFKAKYRIEQIVYESSIMQQLLDKARKYGESDASILIQGETGTGKELLAQSIHNLSDRSDKPFIAVNCSALPESLLESELFGYEEGAFTGAKKGGKIGLFELASGGTIFLDEIADISPNIQVKLLRVIEEREVMRLGGDRVVPVDVRIISSSYKDLWPEVQSEKFRMDLYFRLAILKLTIPPLRDRKQDIPLIVQRCFLRAGASGKAITPGMLHWLMQHSWPGNIRELDSLIRRYLILLGDRESDESLFRTLVDDFCRHSMKADAELPVTSSESASSDKTLKELLDVREADIIRQALIASKHNKQETAQRLGISVNTLWRRIRSLSPYFPEQS